MEADILKLPQDEDLVRKLQGKLLEYAGRIEEHKYQHPELNNYIVLNSTYKAIILTKLLREGQVNSWDLSKQMHKKMSPLDVNLFDRCYGVIGSYIVDPNNVIGGTGLTKRNFTPSQLEEVLKQFRI